MALETAFQDLYAQLHKLSGVAHGMRLTIVEDKPLTADVALVDALGDATEDLLGWIQEAREAAADGRQAVRHPLNMERAVRALTTCQEKFNLMMHRFTTDLASYERLSTLNRLGQERKGEWPAWARSVRAAVDKYHQPSYDVSQALFVCWKEIAERVGMTSVSVQATNIGQQITVPEARELAQERLP